MGTRPMRTGSMTNGRQARATPTPHNPARPAAGGYALFLGYLSGARGNGLFTTLWARLLDIPPARAHDLAFEASRRGWIDYRRAGDVVDVGFSAVCAYCPGT